MTRKAKPTKPFIFFRMHEGTEMFYVVNLYGDPEDIESNVKLNPGTLRVEDVLGNVVWKTPSL